MKEYEVRNRESNRKGFLTCHRGEFHPYRVKEPGCCGSEYYVSLKEVEADWRVPDKAKYNIKKEKFLHGVILVLIWSACIVPVITAIMFGLCVGWDYNTGQDTGYISAVDKMTFTEDYTIYLRRRPLSAQGFTSAERDEVEYCTTSDYPEVVQKAYEAITSGKRVVLVYDKPKEFGWKKFGGCNSAPITDVIPVEE